MPAERVQHRLHVPPRFARTSPTAAIPDCYFATAVADLVKGGDIAILLMRVFEICVLHDGVVLFQDYGSHGSHAVLRALSGQHRYTSVPRGRAVASESSGAEAGSSCYVLLSPLSVRTEPAGW